MVVRLAEQGHDVIRVNHEDYPRDISLSYMVRDESLPRLSVYGRSVDLKIIRSIWYRVPFLFQARRWAQDHQLSHIIETACRHMWFPLETFLNDCFWMNRPMAVHRANFKILQLRAAQEVGFCIPKTCITNNPAAAKQFFTDVGGKMIAKTLSAGALYDSDNRTYVVFTNPVSSQDMEKIDSLAQCPCQLQEYVPKEVELRVVVVGDTSFAVEIDSQKSEKSKHDWRHYDFENVAHRIHKLSANIQRQCIEVTRKLGLVFAALDLILTPDHQYVFLEANPCGQYGWLEHFTGIPLTETVTNVLARADKS